MIAHALNVRGPLVSHGLNPRREVLELGFVLEFDVGVEVLLELAPDVQADALEDLEASASPSAAMRVTVDELEDASGTFTIRGKATVE